MKEVLTKDIGRIWYEGEYYSKMYKGNKLVWPPDYLKHESIEYTFDENTGKFQVVQDAGFIEYLLDNTTIYLVKSAGDNPAVAIPLYSEPDYNNGSMKYRFQGDANTAPFTYRIDKSPSIYNSMSKIDVMTQIPTIYFRSKEIGDGLYDINFSTYPFDGCHEVFGPERLIGLYSGQDVGDKWYSNVNVASKHTFTECKQFVANKGKGWYGAYSEEIGVLMMLAMFKSGVNGDCLTYSYTPFGVANPFTNGGGGRNYLPNIEIDPATNIAAVHHLDGNTEYLKVPYIWGKSFSKLYWDEYLTILPKQEGTGCYNTKNEVWMGNSKGIGIYLATGEGKWSIAGDRDDSDILNMSDNLRIRVCYHGDYVITNDIKYFEELPVL